jgi:hypothetical protein
MRGFNTAATQAARFRKNPVRTLLGHGDAHAVRPRVAHGVADRFLRDAQQLVLVLGLQAGADATAFEGAGDPTGYRRALSQLAQRQLQSRTARLIQTQRHDRAARFGKPIARELADARECHGELRAALATGREFLHRTELQQDAGESLGEAVMDLLADARALHEHRGFLGRVGQPRELHGKCRLLRQRYQQLAARHLLGLAAEGHGKKSNAAAAEHERVEHGTGNAVGAVELEQAGPCPRFHTGDVHIQRLAQIGVARSER